MIKNFKEFINESYHNANLDNSLIFKNLNLWIDKLDPITTVYVILWNIVAWENFHGTKPKHKKDFGPSVENYEYHIIDEFDADEYSYHADEYEIYINNVYYEESNDIVIYLGGDVSYHYTPYKAATHWDPPEGGDLIVDTPFDCDKIELYIDKPIDILKMATAEQKNELETLGSMCLNSVSELGIKEQDFPELPKTLEDKIVNIIKSDEIQNRLIELGETGKYKWSELDPLIIDKEKYKSSRGFSKMKNI